MAEPTATVAGAGALGLSVALALADAGWRVTVCDPAPPAANASGVAAGMLAPVFEAVLDPAAADHFPLLLAARDLWPAFSARSGVAIDRSGALAAGRSGWLAEVAGAMVRLGLHPAELPLATARALAPGLSAKLDGALLCREDWLVDARTALSLMRLAAEAAGVQFAAVRVEQAPPADLMVVATGWERGLEDLAPELAVVAPIRGHLLRTLVPEAWGCVVRGERGYAAPFAGGLSVGATMEAGVDDPGPDPAKAAPLRAAGAELFPAVAAADAELVAGVRGATPDGLPLVGPSRSRKVLLAAGARRNGWLLAPLVGRMIAAYATGADPGPYARAFDPARFG